MISLTSASAILCHAQNGSEKCRFPDLSPLIGEVTYWLCRVNHLGGVLCDFVGVVGRLSRADLNVKSIIVTLYGDAAILFFFSS